MLSCRSSARHDTYRRDTIILLVSYFFWLPQHHISQANATACNQQLEDGHKEARVVVDSEEEPLRVLLETKIHREDGFQKQQGMSQSEVQL